MLPSVCSSVCVSQSSALLCFQVSRKLLLTEADLEQAEAKTEAAEM